MQDKVTGESVRNPFSALDLEHLERTTGGDRNLMRKLLEMLLVEIPVHKQRLRQAETANDCRQLIDLVHKLQGSAAYTGAQQIRKAALQTETVLRQSASTGQLRQSLADLYTRLDELADKCNLILRKLPAPQKPVRSRLHRRD